MKKEVRKRKITKKVNVKIPQFNPSYNYYSEHDKNFKTPKKSIFSFLKSIKSQHLYIALLLIVGIGLVQLISSTYGVDYGNPTGLAVEDNVVGANLFSFTNQEGLTFAFRNSDGLATYRSSDGLIEQVVDADGKPFSEIRYRYDGDNKYADTYIADGSLSKRGSDSIFQISSESSPTITKQTFGVTKFENGNEQFGAGGTQSKISLNNLYGFTAAPSGTAVQSNTEILNAAGVNVQSSNAPQTAETGTQSQTQTTPTERQTSTSRQSSGGSNAAASGTFMDPIINAVAAVIGGALNIFGFTLTTITTSAWALMLGVFVFIAAMVYLGLDKVKFITDKKVKIIISCAVAFIVVAMGRKYILEIAQMASALVYLVVILLIMFVVWILWNNLRTVERTARTETLTALTANRNEKIAYLKADVEKNVTKMMAKTLSDVKKGEVERVPEEVASIEQNFRRIHNDVEFWLRTIEHHGDPNIVNPIQLPSDWGDIKNQIQRAYVGINENLNKAKQQLHNDLNAANDSLRKANSFLQMYDSLLGRLEHYARHNQLAQMPFTGRNTATRRAGTTVPARARPQGGSGSTIRRP
ncbi:hypothetical protein J4405_00185 [Candidatus Woesearchaeota archaeon]|nr:hypothetical protein [Candidatus Woesearchaeota archaeon]